MTNGQVQVITSVQRRRRWSLAEKERIVAASLEAGATLSAVAREAGVHASQLFRWRQQLCGERRARSAFAAVRIAPHDGTAPTGGTIDIEFAAGTRVRITGAVDPGTISAALTALVQGERRR